MNKSDCKIPWDDPRWLSDEENSSNNLSTKKFSGNKQIVSKTLPQNNKWTDDEYVNDFKKFSLSNSQKNNEHNNMTSNYQKQDRRHVSSGEWTNKNNKKKFVGNNDPRTKETFPGHSSTNDKDPVAKDDEQSYESVQKEADNVVLDSSKKKDISRHIEDFKEKEDNVTNDDGSNGKLRPDEVHCHDKKPAIQIYNAATVRGKWSGLTVDQFQDVREERRRGKRGAFNNGNRRNVSSQDKRQPNGGFYSYNNNDNYNSSNNNNQNNDYGGNRTTEMRNQPYNDKSYTRFPLEENGVGSRYDSHDKQYDERTRNSGYQRSSRGRYENHY